MNKRNMILSIVSIITGAITIILTLAMPPKVAYFPKLAALMLIALGVLLLILSIRGGGVDKKLIPSNWKNVLAIISMLFVYYFLYNILGYVICMFILMVSTMYILGYRKRKTMTLISAVTSGVLYLLFSLVFNVDFPTIIFL